MLIRSTLISLLVTVFSCCTTEEPSLVGTPDKGKVILVNDTAFQSELRSYLIRRITDYYVDSTGRQNAATDMYTNMWIIVVDLLKGKLADTLSSPGIYKVQFGCEDCGAPPELLIRNKFAYSFLNLDKGGLTRSQLLDTVGNFLSSNSNVFNNADRTEINKQVIRVFEDRPNY